MQQKYCLCTPAHQLTIVFTLNLTEIIKISRQFTSAMCCKNVGGYSFTAGVLGCNIHFVLEKVYHPTHSDKFNSSCPILVIFGSVITERICFLATAISVYALLGKVYDNINHKIRGKRPLFDKVSCTLFVHHFSVSWQAYNKAVFTADELNSTQLNWPASSWPNYTSRYWSCASASWSWLAARLHGCSASTLSAYDERRTEVWVVAQDKCKSWVLMSG